jgi:hypothetical protein
MKIAASYSIPFLRGFIFNRFKTTLMKISIFFFLLCISIFSVAQENKMANYIPHMTFSIGATFQEFDGLDSRIENFSQYKELKNHMATLQLGWLKEHKRVVSDLAFTAGTSMNGDRDTKSSNLRFLGISTDVGYNVLSNKLMMLYPMVGIGYEKYQARFFSDNSDIDFNSILQSGDVQNNLDPVQFKNSFFTYRLGAGFALRKPKNPSHSIGLQAGYIGSFKDHAWKSNENKTLMNAPEDGLKRVYVQLTIMCQPSCMKGK